MSTDTMALPSPIALRTAQHERGKKEWSIQATSEKEEMVEPMNEKNQAQELSPDEGDNLQQIKGIGQSVEKALNSLGIYRYTDLANFNPGSLADLLKAEIPSISSKRIEREDWLDQARTLASIEPAPSVLEPHKKESVAPPTEGQEMGPGKSPHEEWYERADFFVSFGYVIDKEGVERLQTKVHHSQADESRQWDGIVTDRLIKWMLSSADLPLHAQMKEYPPVAEDRPAEKPQTFAEESAYLEISDLWVSEVKVPVKAGGGRPQAMLRAEGRLNLSGPRAKDLTYDRNPCTVDLYLVNTESNHSELVSTNTEYLTPDALVYEIYQDFGIPPAGHYQLHVVARLSPPGATIAYLQGPIIRVEP